MMTRDKQFPATARKQTMGPTHKSSDTDAREGARPCPYTKNETRAYAISTDVESSSPQASCFGRRLSPSLIARRLMAISPIVV